MNTDVEKLLAEVKPRVPSADLRKRVLNAVDAELDNGEKTVTRPKRTSFAARWERRIGWASVVGLLLAVGLNALAYRVGDARLATFQHPTPIPQYIADITETIESATDPATARWFHDRLVAQWRASRPTPEDPHKYYQQILRQVALFEKELCHVHRQTNRKSPQVGGDRSGRSRDDTSYRQRHRGLDHQRTA